MTRILLLGLLLFFSIATAQTQTEMNSSEKTICLKADKELNEVYIKILKEYSKNEKFIEKLKIAQRLWIKFRDAHIESIYPGEDKQFKYGSVYPMCYWIQMTTLTKDRTDELKIWLDGIEEGDVCSGSVKIK